MTNEKTIRVMGTGEISIKPDTTRLSFEVESVFKDYAAAYEAAAIGNADLRNALKELSVDPDSLKTQNFTISKKFESVRRNDDYRREFKGFELCQALSLELPIDGTLVSRVLTKLGNAWPDLEVNISYIKKDTTPEKNAMLEKAVQDAKAKAQAMTAALGYMLGDIISIDYSKRTIDINYREENYICCNNMADKSASNLDVVPDDIKAKDTVETVWSIC